MLGWSHIVHYSYNKVAPLEWHCPDMYYFLHLFQVFLTIEGLYGGHVVGGHNIGVAIPLFVEGEHESALLCGVL